MTDELVAGPLLLWKGVLVPAADTFMGLLKNLTYLECEDSLKVMAGSLLTFGDRTEFKSIIGEVDFHAGVIPSDFVLYVLAINPICRSPDMKSSKIRMR